MARPVFMNSKQVKLSLCLLTLANVYHYPSVAHAAQWNMKPSVTGYFFYDDNLQLTDQEEVTTGGSFVTAAADFNRKTETSHLGGIIKIDDRRYYDLQSINSTDTFLDLTANKQYERLVYALAANYTRDTTITSELEGTGSIQTVRDRTSYSIQPGFTYKPSEISSITFNYSYQDIDYDALASEFTDYTYETISFLYDYQWNQKTGFQVQLSSSEYEAPDIGFAGIASVTSETLTDSAMLGLSHQFNERTAFSILVGRRESKKKTIFPGVFSLLNTSSKDDGGIYTATLDYYFLNGQINTRASREVTPVGNGAINISDKLDASLGWRFTARDRASFNMLYIETKPDTANSSTSERQYYQFSPKYIRELSREWSMDVGYQYRRQHYRGQQDKPDSNRLFLSLQYQWQR